MFMYFCKVKVLCFEQYNKTKKVWIYFFGHNSKMNINFCRTS